MRHKVPIVAVVIAGVASMAALAAISSHARQAAKVLLAQDDPGKLADAQLAVAAIDAARITREIDQALAAKDPGLAQSFCDLAVARGIVLPEQVTARVADAVKEQASTAYMAKQFGSGLVRGEADDLASLTGTVAGDLFVFGDIRDVVRERARMARGEEPDRLVLGLAAAGIAVTAATYVSLGEAAPVRAGLSLVKDARKAGRLGEGLTAWGERSAREIVDTEEMQQALSSASLLRPTATADAVRAAFRADKAGEVLRTVKDAGRVGESAGLRGALDTLRVAEGPKDVARAARLAESKGSQTRAIIKLFGRGALLLAAGAFDLSLWLVGAAVALFGFLCSIKAGAERIGEAWSRRARARHALKQASRAVPALAVPA